MLHVGKTFGEGVVMVWVYTTQHEVHREGYAAGGAERWWLPARVGLNDTGESHIFKPVQGRSPAAGGVIPKQSGADEDTPGRGAAATAWVADALILIHGHLQKYKLDIAIAIDEEERHQRRNTFAFEYIMKITWSRLWVSWD